MVVVVSSPVSAHHSPHFYVTLETTDERGGPLEWTVQTSSTLTMTRVG